MGKYLFWIALTALLAACGGGSGEHDGEDGRTSATPIVPASPVTPVIPVSTLDFPVEAVFSSLATSVSTFSASAADAAGNSYLLSVDFTPGLDKTDTRIYATPLKTFKQTNIVKKNGVIASTINFEDFYLLGPYYFFGSLNNVSDTNNYMKVITHSTLPLTGRVGTAGSFFNGENHIKNAILSPDTWHATWSVEADTATTAWLCLNIAMTSTNGPIGLTAETDCYRINQAGNISGFKADITENGIKLNYR